jgi:hypothetical protein
MLFEVTQPITDPDQVEKYYNTIWTTIGGNTNDSRLWLVKRKGWIATVAYSGEFYSHDAESRLMRTLSQYGYKEFVAIAWSKVHRTPPVLILPITVEALEELIINTFCWYVFFAGEPDWFILFAHTLDYLIVAGQPEFVRQVLGRAPEAAAAEIREMSESENLNPVVCRYYKHLLWQTQVLYPQAQSGEIVNLGLLNWEEPD